jgi:hypothetical protein
VSNGNGVEGGVCCFGSTCEPSDPATCQQAGGDYNRSSPTGVCFITQIIQDYLKEEHAHDGVVWLLAGGTYSLLYEARDRILEKWAVGRRALELYREHGAEVLQLARKDRELRRHILFTFLKLAMFSRVLLRHLWTGKTPPDTKARYTLAMHKELIALMYRLDASGVGPEGIKALRSILDDVETLVDRPIPDLLRAIGVSGVPKEDKDDRG